MDWSKVELIEENETCKKWQVQITDSLKDGRSLLCGELEGLPKEDMDDSYTTRAIR